MAPKCSGEAPKWLLNAPYISDTAVPSKVWLRLIKTKSYRSSFY